MMHVQEHSQCFLHADDIFWQHGLGSGTWWANAVSKVAWSCTGRLTITVPSAMVLNYGDQLILPTLPENI